MNKNWSWLDTLTERLDEDFIQAATEEVSQQERPALDKLFNGAPEFVSAIENLT